MFDVTPSEISQLNDTDLRELVGRLCEADLAHHRLSIAAVTWGGNQTAADGGLDVRVALTPATSIQGFIPRAWTGFQVKASDMPRAKILAEMRPGGTIRAAIERLGKVCKTTDAPSGSAPGSNAHCSELESGPTQYASASEETLSVCQCLVDFPASARSRSLSSSGRHRLLRRKPLATS
jgi:hypothetical protein